MKRIVNAWSKRDGGKRAYAVILLYAATTIALPAQTFTTLFSFDLTDGAKPAAALVQGADGNLYGTTRYGGTNNNGRVFKITPAGELTTLYAFCSPSGCPAGREPLAALAQGTNGDFYGTTGFGGANYGGGTVFKITPSGTLTALYSFCSQAGCTDGEGPSAALVQAANGDFYGTTGGGGANNRGTVFRIPPNGTLTALYAFCSQTACADGEGPSAALVQATNGAFYGTTFNGGANGVGTVFHITPKGTLTTLYSFCSQPNCADGASPRAALVQATDGDFYGTTMSGGPHNAGTVFKITPSGTLTTLHSFCSETGCSDGQNPHTGLVQATDGNFYGTTFQGGANDGGVIFRITPSGALTTLYSFCSQGGGWCTDGESPYAGLVQATNGDFYGTTQAGGASSAGTVFSLSVGLGAFVKTLPHTGQVGQVIRILGSDLTGATAVSFNGTPAAFTVVAQTQITATVPVGANTGTLQVTTPADTLLSAGPFTVLP